MATGTHFFRLISRNDMAPDRTIVEDWESIEIPSPPELQKVSVKAGTTALLILDVQNQNCNRERRPRCVASLPKIQGLLADARSREVPIIYSLTRSAAPGDIRKEVAPIGEEPVVSSGVDKFYNTPLEEMLRDRNIDTLILVGTSAHGAVLHTATGAVMRSFHVVVPLDCISSSEAYSEQYTAWHLANSPGCRGHVTLTKAGLISM